jgi:hypothetical protein
MRSGGMDERMGEEELWLAGWEAKAERRSEEKKGEADEEGRRIRLGWREETGVVAFTPAACCFYLEDHQGTGRRVEKCLLRGCEGIEAPTFRVRDRKS